MPTISDAHIDSILEISELAAECADEARFPPSLMRNMTDLFGFHRAPGKPHYGAEEHLKARLFSAQIAGALRLKKLSDDLGSLRALVEELRNGELVSEARLEEYAITPREREIVRHVSRGLTTMQVADRLGISEKTVEQHLDHLYRKTGTHNRTALIYRLSR